MGKAINLMPPTSRTSRFSLISTEFVSTITIGLSSDYFSEISDSTGLLHRKVMLDFP